MSIGKYKGRDKYKGYGTFEKEMQSSGEEAADLWSATQGEEGITGGAGIGAELTEEGLGGGFDITDINSIAEALGKKQFEQDFRGDLGATKKAVGEGESVYEGATGTEADSYATFSEDDIENMWQEQKGDYADPFLEQAKVGGVTQHELDALSPGAQEWRKMAAPMRREATDIYRQGVGQIAAQSGGLKTGSAAQRRQDLLGDYGQSMVGIGEKIRGERGKRSKVLADRIRKMFA